MNQAMLPLFADGSDDDRTRLQLDAAWRIARLLHYMRLRLPLHHTSRYANAARVESTKCQVSSFQSVVIGSRRQSQSRSEQHVSDSNRFLDDLVWYKDETAEFPR